jgi:alpha-galactosidase
MGWNSYNTFCCEPTEDLLREVADAMVSSGLRDAGYRYVNIDDGWMARERDEAGNLVAHPAKFPNGMKAVVDYIHSKGLKAGIYLGAGLRTYGEYPGSLGREAKDARLIAGLDFDFLKYDYRTLPEDPPRTSVRDEYALMRACLEAAGRPMVFSICEHGRSDPWTWGRGVGQLWRTTPDIKDGWEGEIKWGFGLLTVLDRSKGTESYAGPGGWNDPDMLVVGLNGKIDWQGPGCAEAEYRSHFALWCASAAPLLIGCDPRRLDPFSKGLLTNSDLIALNQDRLGAQGYAIARRDGYEVWKKPLDGGSVGVCLFNRSSAEVIARAAPAELGLDPAASLKVRDAWNGRNSIVEGGRLEARVAPHDTAVFIASPL